jgi:hypothetical protein
MRIESINRRLEGGIRKLREEHFGATEDMCLVPEVTSPQGRFCLMYLLGVLSFSASITALLVGLL